MFTRPTRGIRSIRGAARAAGGSSRRGTVLLLVLGALAMVLILAVVYAALGKGDRRTASAANDRADAQETVGEIGSYLAGVIGDDVFDVSPDLSDANALSLLGRNSPILRRETADFPFTDPFSVSVPGELGLTDPALITAAGFRPSGGHDATLIWNDTVAASFGYSSGETDPRVPGDPWLAATRPVDLGINTGNVGPFNVTDPASPAYARATDWLQISNIGPDGRFVNLFYLRDGGSPDRGFGAPSIDLTRNPSGGAARLTLFDASGAPTGNLPYDEMLGGSGGVLADWNVPAHWTMHQRQMFRLVSDLEADATLGDVGSPDYWAYQYADADGDGIVDTRWTELVDSSDPLSPKPILGDTKRRYFVAARAIDLSSLVNVNTARDALTAPLSGLRAGSGPHEVSLFSLLHMNGRRFAHAGENEIVDGGVQYARAFDTVGPSGEGDYTAYLDDDARMMGRKAYLRIVSAGQVGVVPVFGVVPGEANTNAAFTGDIRDYTRFHTAEERAAFHGDVGSVHPGSSWGGNARPGPFNVDDLVELLTYHGVNDSETFSGLERALVGHNADAGFASLSPLRSDRKTELELGTADTADRLRESATDIRRLLTTVSGHRPLRSSILDQAQIARLDEGRELKVSLDELVLDDGRYPNDLDGNTLADYQAEVAGLLADTFGVYLDTLAPNLDPQAWEGGWENPVYPELQTQFYGHMGPELAVRLAAHSAINFRDMADAPFVDVNPQNGVPDFASVLDLDLEDPVQNDMYGLRNDEPTAAVLQLSESFNPSSDPLMQQLWDAGLRFDVNEVKDATGLLAPAAADVSHEAMILYGVEPQPFLGEVASLCVYVDAPREGPQTTDDFDNLANGSVHGEYAYAEPGDDLIPGSRDDYDGYPNIDGAVDAANPDFLFQVLLVQLFNPFDVPIVLNDYYIEYANSFYLLHSGTSTSPLILQPRSSYLAWVGTPNDAAEMDARINDAIDRIPGASVTLPPATPGAPPTPTMIQAIIQAKTGVAVEEPMQRYEITAGGTRLVPGDEVLDVFYGDPAMPSNVNRVVLLWRDVGQRQNRMFVPFLFDTGAPFQDDMLVDRLHDTSVYAVSGVALGGSNSRGALDRRLALPRLPGPNRSGTFIENAVRGHEEARTGLWSQLDDSPPIGPPWINYGGIDFTARPTEMRAISFALWGSIRRHDDATPSGGSSNPSGTGAVNYHTTTTPPGTFGNYQVTGTPIGAMPAAIIEGASSEPFTSVPPALDNSTTVAGDGDYLRPEALTIADDIEVVHAESDVFLSDLINRLMRSLPTDDLGGLRSLGTPIHATDRLTLGYARPLTPSTVFGGDGYTWQNYVQITVNQNEFRDILTGRRSFRVGDMLLPLAVGAYRTPLEPLSTGSSAGVFDMMDPEVRILQYEAQWTTLGESLAAGLGYADAVGPQTVAAATSAGPDDPFAALTYDKSTGVTLPKDETYVLDRGHLRLDAFVPFYDDDQDALFTAGTDIRRGRGVPLALTLFDNARAGDETGALSFGGIDRPTMGTVNVNTAEPEVLRLLPGLSHDVGDPEDRLSWGQIIDSVYSDQRWNMNQQILPATPLDVGSSIADYREPSRRVYLRTNYTGFGSPGGGFPTIEAALSSAVPNHPTQAERGVALDRAATSGVTDIRTQPGLLSLGELFAVRDVNAPPTQVRYSMDGFARDDRTLGVAFIDHSSSVDMNDNHGLGTLEPRTPAELTGLGIATLDGQLVGDILGLRDVYGTADANEFPGWPGPDGDPATLQDNSPLLPVTPDQIPDDYDEQLAQLNMVLNSTSVGSDYYAVWFVVHGYTEEDTLDLGDDDPLTPSFKGRYLMILDRSNVVRKGDQPRVLAFIELPVEAPEPATIASGP